jgi:peroxiredoxin
MKPILTLLAAMAMAFGAHAGDAPAFTLTDTNGKEHSLSDFEGKVVVLEWFNQGCPFVKKHYKNGNMQSLQNTYTGKGVVWLTVCSSAPGEQGHMDAAGHNKTIGEWKIQSTAFLMDEDGKVGRAYGAKTTPHMYVIDAGGQIVYQGAIDDKRSTDAADIPDSKNYVRAALDAVLAGEAVETSQTKPYGCSVKYAKD